MTNTCKHIRSVLDSDGGDDYSFFETVGLECALWPHLFWITEKTLTYELATYIRRQKPPTMEQLLLGEVAPEEYVPEDCGCRHSVRHYFWFLSHESHIGLRKLPRVIAVCLRLSLMDYTWDQEKFGQSADARYDSEFVVYAIALEENTFRIDGNGFGENIGKTYAQTCCGNVTYDTHALANQQRFFAWRAQWAWCSAQMDQSFAQCGKSADTCFHQIGIPGRFPVKLQLKTTTVQDVSICMCWDLQTMT